MSSLLITRSCSSIWGSQADPQKAYPCRVCRPGTTRRIMKLVIRHQVPMSARRQCRQKNSPSGGLNSNRETYSAYHVSKDTRPAAPPPPSRLSTAAPVVAGLFGPGHKRSSELSEL